MAGKVEMQDLNKLPNDGLGKFVSADEIVKAELDTANNAGSLNSRLHFFADNTEYDSEEAKIQRIVQVDLMLNILQITGTKKGNLNFKKKLQIDKSVLATSKELAVDSSNVSMKTEKKESKNAKVSQIDALLAFLKGDSSIDNTTLDVRTLKQAKELANQAPSYNKTHWWNKLFKKFR